MNVFTDNYYEYEQERLATYHLPADSAGHDGAGK